LSAQPALVARHLPVSGELEALGYRGVIHGVLRVGVLESLDVVGGHGSALTGVVDFRGCITKASPNFLKDLF
jgi:hypothetical protein